MAIFKVPACKVTPPVEEFTPERVMGEVALFWKMPVTFAPIGALTVTPLVPAVPALVRLPAKLSVPPERVIVPVVVAVLRRVMLPPVPVLVIPPVTVRLLVVGVKPTPPFSIDRSWLLSVIAPVTVGWPVVV